MKRAEIYKIFGGFYDENPNNYDWSDEAQDEFYLYESRGQGREKLAMGVITLDMVRPNGYNIGKRWMEVTVSMWIEDIRRGTLFAWELYEEGRYPNWWLDETFNRRL